MGVIEDSITMEIDGSTASFNSANINDGYSIQYTPSSPLQSGEHSVTITAQTNSEQEFSYSWIFYVRPEISEFRFPEPDVTGVINENEKTIALTVPFGTDLTALEPSIHNGASVSPASGTAQDFTNSVTYTVRSNDGSTQNYIVTVTEAASTAKEITSFSVAEQTANSVIDEDENTITLTVQEGTDIASLVPTIIYTGESVSPASGTAQDFTNPVTYTVIAEDGSTQDYLVTVNVETSSQKTITAFVFSDIDVQGTINEAEKTITATVEHGTDLTSLTPDITHTGKSIDPESEIAQDFRNPVVYRVTAEDDSTQEYTVAVSEAASTSKSITEFRFTEPEVDGTINEEEKAISLTVPAGTNVTSLTPAIRHSGESISPENRIAQDFTEPVTYTVSAEDGSTLDYTVTVTVEASSEKVITSFSFQEPDVNGSINEEEKTITMTVPYGTDISALVPDVAYTGTNLEPESGTAQNFANPVNYTVTAEDDSTKQYTVTVNVASSTDKSITSFSFTEPAVEGLIDEDEKTINLEVPEDTNVSSLIPVITHTGINITPASMIAQDFTNPVNYTVTAGDSSTWNYTVTVNIEESSSSTASTSGGGGGGGGGGGTTGEEFENIELKDVSSIFVIKDKDIMFEFDEAENDITYVGYKSLKNSGTITVTIEILKDKSSFADSLPEGDTYRNINIWVGKAGYATEENIENPVVGFRVPVSWIDENNIDSDSIVLERYDDGWEKLSTVQTGSDDEYIYFESETPGFSPLQLPVKSMLSG
ncbi:MAG: DUF5018 domain-containing protein [Methanolobus sp.]